MKWTLKLEFTPDGQPSSRETTTDVLVKRLSVYAVRRLTWLSPPLP